MSKSENKKVLKREGRNTSVIEGGHVARFKRVQKLENTLLEKRLVYSLAKDAEKNEKQQKIQYVDPEKTSTDSDLLALNEDNDAVLGSFSEKYDPKVEDNLLPLKTVLKLSSKGLVEKSTFHKFMIFILFAAAIWLSLASTAEYFIYQHHGWCGARRTLAARNYLRYGYLNLKMGPLDTRGYHVKENGKPKFDKFYWHHPPLVSVTLSFVYDLFGESEANARLMSAALFWIIFIFLWLSFRNHWGDAPTFYSLTMLVFMPFIATYNNFINFELMVTVWMAISLFAFDRYLDTKRNIYAALLFVSMFLGAYADYPMFVWMFYLWVVGVIRYFYVDRKLRKFLLYYVFAVFVILVLVALQIIIWKDSGSFSGLYGGRFKSNYTILDTIWRTLQKWHFYYGFFGPIAYAFMTYYLVDLVKRVRKFNITRADGYLVAFGLTGVTYAIAVKDGTWVHTFFIWYFALFVGLSSGYGIFRFLQHLKVVGLRKAHLAGFLILVCAMVWALPIIQMKRTNPIYTYTKPIYKTDSYLKMDYDLDKQVTAFIAREITGADEFVLIDEGMPVGRNEFLTNMDRQYKVTKDQREFIKKAKKDKYSLFVVNIEKIDSNFTLDLVKNYNFIAYKSFFIFDLKGDKLPALQTRIQHFVEVGDFERFFISLAHGKFYIEDNPLLALDYSIKFNNRKSANYYREMFSGKYKMQATDLEGEVAIYNNKLDLGKEAEIRKIFRWVDKPEKKYYFGPIELVGQKIYRRFDGRSEVLLVFKTEKSIEQNYDLVVEGVAKHKDKNLRKDIGKKHEDCDTIIPTSIWKPDFLYIVRIPLDLESGGPYKINFHFKFKDAVEVENISASDRAFKFRCKDWDTLAIKDVKKDSKQGYVREWMKEVNLNLFSNLSLDQRIKQAGLYKVMKQKNIGDEFAMLGCFAEKTKHKGKYKTSILMMNKSTRPLGWEFNISGKGREKDKKGKYKTKYAKEIVKLRKETRKLKPLELFWVEVDIPFNASGKKLELTVNTRKNTSLKIRDDKKKKIGKKEVMLFKGMWGIRRPFPYLEKLLIDPLMK